MILFDIGFLYSTISLIVRYRDIYQVEYNSNIRYDNSNKGYDDSNIGYKI